MTSRFRWLFFLLLSLALPLAQQGAALHALSHFSEPAQSQQDKHLPHSTACEKCVAYAGVGGAVAANALTIPPSSATAALVDTERAGIPPRFLSRYRSRAPPQIV